MENIGLQELDKFIKDIANLGATSQAQFIKDAILGRLMGIRELLVNPTFMAETDSNYQKSEISPQDGGFKVFKKEK